MDMAYVNITSVRQDFQTFRNNLHHRLRSIGDIDLLLEILEQRVIDYYEQQEDMLKALYLLSFIDYTSKNHNIPLCSEYSSLRRKKLVPPYYVGDMVPWRDDSNCIDEFVLHNIYEGDLYDAI